MGSASCLLDHVHTCNMCVTVCITFDLYCILYILLFIDHVTIYSDIISCCERIILICKYTSFKLHTYDTLTNQIDSID